MDPPFSPEREPSKLYTREEVISTVTSFYATPSDYLIKTYFKINRILNGPTFKKFERRFNNIIFNNFEKVMKHLAIIIYEPKSKDVVRNELPNISYISCIFPGFEKVSCPFFIQFFTPERGIEHRILEYAVTPAATLSILTRWGVVDKVVGYMGDYCYKDPDNSRAIGDHVVSVSVLNGRTVMDLPYADRFINTFFDLLLDYLPGDPSKCIMRLGETVMGMRANSQCLKDLVRNYKEYKESGDHILASSFTDFVIKNFDLINASLYPCQFLSLSIGTLLSNVLQRFFLVFMADLFLEVQKIQFIENSAIAYYFYLKRIRDLFQTYEDTHHVPERAYTYYNTEINRLVDNKQVDEVKDNETILTFNKELLSNVTKTHVRALKFLNSLINQMDQLEPHCWILLNDIPLKPEDVHKSYHLIHEVPCTNCQELIDEVTIVNIVMRNIPVVEIDNAANKWVVLLNECDIPKITDLMKYLWSLPTWCRILGEDPTGDALACAQRTTRLNMSGIKDEDIVDNIEGFFQDYWDNINIIVRRNQIQLLRE